VRGHVDTHRPPVTCLDANFDGVLGVLRSTASHIVL
jgi:hypothetical protein